MVDIEIKRGYEVLPDNNVRFGVRVINNSDFAISDVEVLLDYSESLFELEGNKVQKLGNIPPTVPRTAKFILKPLGCIHKEEIGATVLYKDHQWKKHTVEMRPKEVHCVCPFLKEKSITRADFLRLSNSGSLEERGVNFDGITVDKLVDFIGHTCKNRLYKVDEFPIENGKILYLAGDALGEKAYYLLTAVVKEYEGLTQVLLRASSDKSYGLNGFLNEILDNLRHLVLSASAREIGIIRKEQVINIIDSVVQRTNFLIEEGGASANIKGSVTQRTEIKVDEEKKRREEERLKKEKEEQERLRRPREEDEIAKMTRGEEERIARDKDKLSARKGPEGTLWKGLFAVALLLGALLLGYWALAPRGNNAPETVQSTHLSTPMVTASATQTPKVTQTILPTTQSNQVPPASTTQPPPVVTTISTQTSGYPVEVLSAPTTVAAGQSFMVTWRVDSPVQKNIYHTAVHYGLDSKSEPLTLTSYPSLTTIRSGTIPADFSSSIIIGKTGIIYFRAHAIIDGTNYWSDEKTITITAVTNPQPTLTQGVVAVDIKGFAFNPATITIPKGTTITWTNSDSAPHTVTSVSGAFDSGSISQGGTFSYTFNQAGTFEYSCTIHPSIVHGKVIVTPTPTPTATATTSGGYGY